jgi:murein DD-endopeptidase MepM/ murein hydrolase activator NlpD
MKMGNIFGRFAFLCGLLLGGFGSAAASVTDYPFKLTTRALGSEQQVVAENSGPAPITVHVSLTGENFATDREWPLTAVVPPYTVLAIGRVYASQKNTAFSFVFRYSHHFGRLDAVHDANAVYRLPYEEGYAYFISQAHGGRLTSHNNRENLYAVDFAMPVGSPIVAARGGVVIDVTLRHQQGGYDVSFIDKANAIAVVHDDGTVAEYAHLSPGPEIVKPGQRVAAGDLLGHSGNTGYSSGPHLHFIVSHPSISDGKVTRVSVPVLFYSSDPSARFSPSAGSSIIAQYHTPAGTPTHAAQRVGIDAPTGRTSQDLLPASSQ